LFNFEGLVNHYSPRIVASRQAKQQAADMQRDVYESHRHRVFALAFYMTGNELEAEQILGGTFIQAFDRAEKPLAEDVDAALIGELRQRFALGEGEPSAPASHELGSNFNLAGRNVRRTELEEAIRTLPATERLLFLLRDVEGYSPAVVAGLTGMPESHVQRSLFSARVRLRHSLAGARAGQLKAA
jgi:DNA-directed RNA polymerase specialized sigma24 family protein